MHDQQPTPIAIAVVGHRGRYLIGRRPAEAPLAGLWEFPGGKVRHGETPQQAAARECAEETGLQVRVDGPLDAIEHHYDHGFVHLQFFACTPLDPAVEPRQPFCWIPAAELPRHEFPAANAAILRRLRQPSPAD